MKTIRDYKVIITSDEDVVRVKKILDYNKQPVMAGSHIFNGDRYGLSCAIWTDKWNWSLSTKTGDISIDEFEKLFGRKQKTTTQMKNTVTREAAKEIYDLISDGCNWKNRVRNIISGTDIFSNEVEIEPETIRQAHGAATGKQKEWLDKYLPLAKNPYKVGDWVLTGNASGWSNHPDDINNRVLRIKEAEENSGDHFGNSLVYFEQKNRDGKYMRTSFDKIQRLATEEEIKEAQYYPDGTPCLIRNIENSAWGFRYADGKGGFYDGGKKSGVSSIWPYHMKLDMNNLPVNQ